MNDLLTLLNGDCLEQLRTLPDKSVNCCVTSPPYYGLRDYGHAGQIGMEETPHDYVNKLVAVFDQVGRVLRDDGTLWLNLGDSYAGSGTTGGTKGTKGINGSGRGKDKMFRPGSTRADGVVHPTSHRNRDWIGGVEGCKAKDMIGIPWRVAFALQDVGWYLREDIIWSKRNCMPESVTDRCTRSHEYIFHLTKSPRYYHDGEAIKEPAIWDVSGDGTDHRKARQSTDNKSMPSGERAGIRPARLKDPSKFQGKNGDKQAGGDRRYQGFNDRWDEAESNGTNPGMRNKRSVWTVAPAQFPDAHFATFPPDLIKPCILAGCPGGGVVLDPFGGSGTTGMVAIELGRRAILIELNPDYCQLIRQRCSTTPGLAGI